MRTPRPRTKKQRVQIFFFLLARAPQQESFRKAVLLMKFFMLKIDKKFCVDIQEFMRAAHENEWTRVSEFPSLLRYSYKGHIALVSDTGAIAKKKKKEGYSLKMYAQDEKPVFSKEDFFGKTVWKTLYEEVLVNS